VTLTAIGELFKAIKNDFCFANPGDINITTNTYRKINVFLGLDTLFVEILIVKICISGTGKLSRN
jgi:hypothetical protein